MRTQRVVRVVGISEERKAAAKRKQAALRQEMAYRNLPRKTARADTVGYVMRTPGGQITADNHYFDAELALTAVQNSTADWTGTELDATVGAGVLAMNCLFAPVTGDDIQNRQGRKVFLKKLRIQGQLLVAKSANTTSARTPNIIRVIVYQDKQTNGTQSQGEQLISSGTATNCLYMFQSTANFGRFRILKDKTFTFQDPSMFRENAADEAFFNGLTRFFKFNLKVNEWVNYNATNGGTVADVIDNSWHLIACTDAGDLIASMRYKVRGVFTP